MDQPLYHVLLQGRRVGPYDRRTIVGMRIKKTLTSADVVVAGNGQQLTVADLVKMGRPDGGFEASRSGSYSVVQAVHSAALVEAKGVAIPKFKDEIEVRLQTKALRLSGRFRTGLGWKEDRVKIALSELVHARARGSLVELALRQDGAGKLQRLVLELFTPESAADLVGALPPLAPWPEGKPAAVSRGAHPMIWGAVVGTALVVGSLLVWVLMHRV
ncbi:hypothetical protein LZ009_07510 [Ramlibacter sp. XY19]|uniref:hypothetical protein n=1 Tax=Ramlibacter paludis TaxID=2908000 RepID=UPI0023D9A264|nr:hypothetical protein [Ramlibacter paludis]MCG2592627.1 hypothetical protein [Ramlibacter paludis]